jgi:hypothetical protein
MEAAAPQIGELSSFIAAHADLEMTQAGKCRCKVTGHEMVPQKAVVEVLCS